MTRGRFITFEGVDGSGKSSQVKRLAEALRARGTTVIETREPGGTLGAEQIRDLLVAGASERWSPETEILLFTAARRDHVEKVIQPALEAGHTVISDRFADSTRVYQGVGRAELRQTVDEFHQMAIAMEPDLTLILDMDPEKALRRGLARDSGEDRFENFGLEFHRRLRTGFMALSREFPNRCTVIPADDGEEEVARRVLEAVDGA